MFNALVLNKKDDQKATGKVEELETSNLPEGDVLINIDYSTINYKDSLAITSSSPIIKNFPMVPGIDFSGTVEESSNNNFTTGDKVILNGFGVGEKYWGGLSQKARVNGNFLVKLPNEFTTKQAMAIGTAGYTAMLCVLALERNGVTPEKGEILVTGATSGIEFATALKCYRDEGACVFATGRNEERLTELSKSLSDDSSTGRFAAMKADVEKESEVKKAVDVCLKMFGKIDCLVNSAGVIKGATAKLM